jgi:hypothetical protein
VDIAMANLDRLPNTLENHTVRERHQGLLDLDR